MKVYSKKSGKLLFFVLHYEFPTGVVKSEKYRTKTQFQRRVEQLKRYQKMGAVATLVS